MQLELIKLQSGLIELELELIGLDFEEIEL